MLSSLSLLFISLSLSQAMYCNLMDAADIACTISTYMEECNSEFALIKMGFLA